MTNVALTRAIPASLEKFSATFSDGLTGPIKWTDVLPEIGLAVTHIRQNTIRVAADGSGIEFDVPVKQGLEPDIVKLIPAHKLYALLSKETHLKKVFEVDGQYGRMTIAFVYTGRVKEAAATEDEARDLELREVQWWYTHRGWPKAGTLIAMDWRGRPKAYWQMV